MCRAYIAASLFWRSKRGLVGSQSVFLEKPFHIGPRKPWLATRNYICCMPSGVTYSRHNQDDGTACVSRGEVLAPPLLSGTRVRVLRTSILIVQLLSRSLSSSGTYIGRRGYLRTSLKFVTCILCQCVRVPACCLCRCALLLSLLSNGPHRKTGRGDVVAAMPRPSPRPLGGRVWTSLCRSRDPSLI